MKECHFIFILRHYIREEGLKSFLSDYIVAHIVINLQNNSCGWNRSLKSRIIFLTSLKYLLKKCWVHNPGKEIFSFSFLHTFVLSFSYDNELREIFSCAASYSTNSFFVFLFICTRLQHAERKNVNIERSKTAPKCLWLKHRSCKSPHWFSRKTK